MELWDIVTDQMIVEVTEYLGLSSPTEGCLGARQILEFYGYRSEQLAPVDIWAARLGLDIVEDSTWDAYSEQEWMPYIERLAGKVEAK